MPTRKDSSFIDTIDSDMAPAFLGLLLFGRKESYRWLVTMSFLFLVVFSCQFAKEILRDLWACSTFEVRKRFCATSADA